MIKSFLNKGHERSINAKKNILFSFVIKGLNIATTLLLVPLTIDYVNKVQYGIWLTLSSIIAWFSFFDMGFGNGLRNKFTEALAHGKHKLAQIYISTTYAIMIIVVILILLLFLIINPLMNWASILNAPQDLNYELRIVALTVFVFFCIQLILQLLTIVLIANQHSAKAALLNLLGNICALVLIVVLKHTTEGGLFLLSLCLSASPVIVLIIASFWYYSKELKKYAPKIKYVRFKFARRIMSLGYMFFVIQIGALILYQTDNIIIAQLLQPQNVTIFNIAYKLFSVISLIFGILVSPYWSAFTDAYTKKEFEWIGRSYNKLIKTWFFLILFTIILLIASPIIFEFWVGTSIEVPKSLSLFLGIYSLGYTWLMIPCFFLNGIGKVKIQFYLYLICICVNIPISILLGKKFGVEGVIFSNVIIFIILGIILHIQSKRIIEGRATGIWLQ